MLVTLLVKFRNKDCKTTELGLLLQVLPVRIVTFVETLGGHLKCKKVIVLWVSRMSGLYPEYRIKMMEIRVVEINA